MLSSNIQKAPCLFAEIDLDAISHNIKKVKAQLSPGVKFMAVVKADAYGHGAVEVSRHAQSIGADFLGVARIEEGIRLRQEGITIPILVFCPAGHDDVILAAENDLSITVASHETAKKISDIAVRENRRVRAHLKIDTGMGRIGLLPSEFSHEHNFWDFGEKDVEAIQQTAKLPNIFFEGIFTHFATSDEPDTSYTESQHNTFIRLLSKLESNGVVFPIRHASNSAAIFRHPSTHLDMVRSGIAFYGLSPFADPSIDLDIIPAMSLKSRIIHLKIIPKNFLVSYGSTWKSDSERLIATVPVGYADSYSRLFSSRAHMLVRGKKVPVAGRVCMDLTMIDVTDVPDAKIGDEVVVFGKQFDSEVSANELARLSGTINYEIVCGLTSRVHKIYKRNGIRF